MGFSVGLQLKHGWNALRNKDPSSDFTYHGPSSSIRPDRIVLTRGNERSIITSIYNRIGIDVASVNIMHALLNEDKRYVKTIDSGLNNCLSVEANIDQTGRSFIQDLVMSMLDEGCVAAVPIETTLNPNDTSSFDITSMRTGEIIEWYPKDVMVRVYNEDTGQKEDIVLPKNYVAIIENPLYSIMNEPNSTAQRLIRKLNLLDVIDEKSGSDKLDLIIQLPYVIKSDLRRQQAEKRREDVENQLANSKYGVAYTDGTERITQLNRPVENNLLSQVEYLTSMLYGQLGITKSVMEGTADEKTMMNYYNRTIEPILLAITEEMTRKFLTKTARSQHKAIVFFDDPFRFVPVSTIATIADTFTRNEILTANEVRQIIGMKPSSDPKADKLDNSNLYPRTSTKTTVVTEEPDNTDTEVKEEIQNG